MYTTALFDCRQIERYLEPYIVLTTNRRGGGGGWGVGGGGAGVGGGGRSRFTFRLRLCHFTYRKYALVTQESRFTVFTVSRGYQVGVHFYLRSQGFPMRKGRSPKQPVQPCCRTGAMGPKNYATGKINEPTSLRLSEGIPQEVRIPAVPRCVVTYTVIKKLRGKLNLYSKGSHGKRTRVIKSKRSYPRRIRLRKSQSSQQSETKVGADFRRTSLSDGNKCGPI